MTILRTWDKNSTVQVPDDPHDIYFPNISKADIDLSCPMYSLWAVDMPVPGPNFVSAAELQSGETAPKNFIKHFIKNGCPEPKSKFVEWLETLHRAALYNQPFSLPIQIPNVGLITGRFIPGGIWGEKACGPYQAKIMIIGKQPGAEELARGYNFIGKTSQELITALDEIGVDENEYLGWYTTNIVRFLQQGLDSSGALPANWVRDCKPLLHQELRLVKPDYILCLGDDAVKGLLGREHKTSSTSGQVLDYTFPLHEFASETPVLHTAKVMTCMHPARVARDPDLYSKFVGSLRLFVKLINGEKVGEPETDLIHYEFRDQANFEAFTRSLELEGIKEFALDCEWHGDDPNDKGCYLRTIQFSWHPKKSACVVVRSADGTMFKGDFVQPLLRLLKNRPDRKVRIIGHNFRADLPWLIHAGIDLRPEFEAPLDDPNPDGQVSLFGWQKTATEGGFDTMLAVHAWQETHGFGLEECTTQLLGMPRYDLELEEWKTQYCKTNKIKKKELEGYGLVPDILLHVYGGMDSVATWRLYDVLNKPDGLLDSDRFGNNCRIPFWISMRASPAFLEMEMNGVMINKDRAEQMTSTFVDVKDKLLSELRTDIKWPEFNLASPRHRTELLFGEQYHDRNRGVKVRSEGALCLNLDPVISTGKRAKLWTDLINREKKLGGSMNKYKPSTGKETLTILSTLMVSDNDKWKINIVKKLRDLSFIGNVLRTVLRPPKIAETDDEDNEEVYELDEAGDKIYSKGLLSEIHDDDRVHTHYFATLETGRASSSRPNLTNLSKKREPDYARILGDRYQHALRSIITSSPGHVLIEADYTAAEVAGVGWMSGDEKLIEHAYRSTLPDTHPDFYDIHSNIGKTAFHLSNLPSKKDPVRVAAKTVFFGYLYGQGSDASARKAREEGAVGVTSDDAARLMDGLNKTYPKLSEFFSDCRSRARDPCWSKNCFGRYRRITMSSDRQVIGENERQMMNFPRSTGEVKQGEFRENLYSSATNNHYNVL